MAFRAMVFSVVSLHIRYTHTHPNITVSVIKYDKTKAEYNAKRYRGSEFLIRKPNAGPC